MNSASPAAPWPSPGHDDRIRRNVACVNCRNSKVRCKQSPTPGQPCQRCAKLDIACVVDKSHKRITKRSKLEKLEQELDAIKQAVRPGQSESPSARPPRSPRANYASTYQDPAQSTLAQSRPFQPTPPSTNLPEHPAGPSGLTAVAKRAHKGEPSIARSIGSYIVSGDDIDYYFDKYFECFHPFIPIVRKRDPDQCYEACQALFWVIILISSRRYARHPDLMTNITENITKDIWGLMATPSIGLEAVHALILISAYPLPTVRFATDPSSTFATLALNACMLMGLHTGRGTHPEFCVGSRQNSTSSDEEAASTWIQACILAQRTASGAGHPPPSIQLNDGPPKRALRSHQWSDLLVMYDIQRYLNRFHLAMASHIAANGSVSETIVGNWEDEFEALKSVIVGHDSDLSRFLLLVAQQEIQCYYFFHPSDSLGPNYRINTTRALSTSKTLINAALTLQSARWKFLSHAPSWAFRAVTDASVMLVSSLRSSYPPPLSHPPTPSSTSSSNEPHPAMEPADYLVSQCIEAVMSCSFREGDLAFRGATLMGGFWANKDQVLPSDTPVMAWPNRLGAGITLWCLHRFNTALQSVQRNSHSDSAANTLKLIQQPYKVHNAGNQSATTEVDPFQEVDWSMFMDDFGWGGNDSVFMGLP